MLLQFAWAVVIDNPQNIFEVEVVQLSEADIEDREVVLQWAIRILATEEHLQGKTQSGA